MCTDSAPPPRRDKAAARSAYVLHDEPEIGTLLAAVLGTIGFSTRTFTTPGPFFKQFDAAVAGLVVVDLALGRSDAIEIIGRLEQLKYEGKILLIGGRDEAILAEIMAGGEPHGMHMLPPLRKPFRASEIRSRLAEPSGAVRTEARKPKRAVPPLASAARTDVADPEVILAVDDNAAVRATMVMQLKELGYAVREADGAQAALEIIDSPERIDLLFTDVIMPGGMNGKELAIEARRRRPNLPVLFTSGFPGSLQNDGVAFDEHDVLLSKPYRRQDLARAVSEMLAARR